jgi:hypothetical protein
VLEFRFGFGQLAQFQAVFDAVELEVMAREFGVDVADIALNAIDLAAH